LKIEEKVNMSVVEFGLWGLWGARRGSEVATTISELFANSKTFVLICFNQIISGEGNERKSF
jgi:hypothetical protein